MRLGEGVHTEAPPSPQSEPLPPFLWWLLGRLTLSPHPFTALARTLCWHLLWNYFCSQRQRGHLLWKVSHRYGLVAAVTNTYQQRALVLTCGFGPLERDVPLVSVRAASPAWVRGWWFLEADGSFSFMQAWGCSKQVSELYHCSLDLPSTCLDATPSHLR